MRNFAIVVEGGHDASFLGQLLRHNNFSAIKRLGAVPTEWLPLFPKNFPMDGENLERVMRFPEIFVREEISVGILTSGSDSRLISTLRSVLDAMDLNSVAGVAVFVDVDANTIDGRFSAIRRQLIAMNAAAVAEKQPGYPVSVPSVPGVMVDGTPSVGIFLFPDNASAGALETILLECAMINHPSVAQAARSMVENLNLSIPLAHPDLRNLRSGMGVGKATVGTIANILKPGASVASSLAQTDWLKNEALASTFVERTNRFLLTLLAYGE